jgi:hypothetical protein
MACLQSEFDYSHGEEFTMQRRALGLGPTWVGSLGAS